VGSRDAILVVVVQKEKPMVTPERDVAVGGAGQVRTVMESATSVSGVAASIEDAAVS
jgi:hypothetical protein